MRIATALAAMAISACCGVAAAGPFHHTAPPKATLAGVPDATIDAIDRAIDEQRLVDAGRMLDEALLAGAKDPRLDLLEGRLSLARGRPDDALAELAVAQTNPTTRADALQYEGIALSLLNRSNEALSTLQRAVTENPSAWRAWNALAGEYDRRRDWTQAEVAYDHAVTDSDSAAITLNNRGFSRMLQGRFDAARDDFVAALEKKPDLAAARTNLRLDEAMKGDYSRAISAGVTEDQAELLNNAGFAALMRGDYVKAEDLLNRAIQVRGVYYAKAADNLAMAKSLADREKAGPSVAQ
jgi:Flp pilus assembly protein TadD